MIHDNSYTLETSVSLERGGIVCTVGSREIYLDVHSGIGDKTTFVSHAHHDHLPPSGTLAIASDETRTLAGLRGIELVPAETNHIDLFDSGHILGSRGLLIDDVFYTGDICTRSRAFMKGAKIPKCNTLITECTFGLSKFSFPSITEVIAKTSRIISKMFECGRPVILMGHELGKAQILTYLFQSWKPLYIYDSIKIMNDAYRKMGINLQDVPSYTKAKSKHLLDNGPWVMIAPKITSKTRDLLEIKSKYNAATISFSGWVGSGYPASRSSADYQIQISDHCDFDELVDMVLKSGAKTVYATHGFAPEFSAHLRSIGINAHALSKD